MGRINTLWGNCIKNYAKMCIPDLAVLADYPIDYRYPIFCKVDTVDISSDIYSISTEYLFRTPARAR